jgi:hypothetical protein
MQDFALSLHASIRAQQRGVPHHLIDALVTWADVEVPVGGGCVAFSLSKRQMSDRGLRAKLGAELDRLAGVALVTDDTGAVVTVLYDRGGAGGRRYRRAR